MSDTTTPQPDYYTRGLAVSAALANDETLRLDLNGAIGDVSGRELFDEWDAIAPGEPFDILGRVDASGELRPIDWAALQGAPSGYRPGRVTMDVVDDAPSIPAYVSAWHRWNGFAVPLFTRETLIASRDALATLFPAGLHEGDGLAITFDADGFPSITDLAEPESGDFVVATEVNGVTLYDIGGGGFIWQDARPEHPHVYDSARSAWQCGTATEDCTRDD